MTLCSSATSEWNRLPRFPTNFLTELLQDVDMQTGMHSWFMLDGAQPHFLLGFREFLNNALPEQSKGRRKPARSPDWNPFYFYLGGDINSTVYD
jgi:hypothetical protein